MHRFCLRFLYDNDLLGADTTIIDEEDQLDYLSTILNSIRAADVKDFLDKAAYIYQKAPRPPRMADSPPIATVYRCRL